MVTWGSDTLGPALAVTKAMDCKLREEQPHPTCTWKDAAATGRGVLPSLLGADAPVLPEHMAFGAGQQGSPGTPRSLLFTSPSSANCGFLFPTAPNGSSLASQPQPFLPALCLYHIIRKSPSSQPDCMPRRVLESNINSMPALTPRPSP